jgi:hypothetical protein
LVVEVDDSGWGDLVGGVVIVMRRLGTRDRYVGEVPVETFQGDAFKKKGYLTHVLRIVREGADALNLTKDEPVRVCTGYILSEVRKALANEGYNVVPSRIVGETQEFAEGEYLKHISRLGVGSPEEARRIRGFAASLAWVLRDVDKRERLVKTGWKAWPRLKKGETVDPKQAKM